MPTFDGLKLLVKFYANHGELSQVEKKTGVSVSDLKKWLAGGELSPENRQLLSKDIPPEYTGKVEVK